MKVAIAQQNYHVGNFDLNRDKILQAVKDAQQLGAELIVFSELSVCGYPPRDFLEFEDFIRKTEKVVEEIAAASHGIGT
jgi:NAD+ synthase (glutamine-hydrolysing)